MSKTGLRSGRFWIWAALLLVSAVTVRAAGTVILRVRAGSPINAQSTQTIHIKSNLPQGVTTNDIVSLGGLELGYDVRNGVYYVHRIVELPPGGVEEYRVEIKDIWVIPEETLEELLQHAESLVKKLKGTEYYATADATRGQIVDMIASIRSLQDSTAVGSGDEAILHVRAFDANVRDLEMVSKLVGRLENLVLSTGQDTGKIIGGYKTIPKPKQTVEIPQDEFDSVILRITVHNTSPDTPRMDLIVKRELPPEITSDDVLDPGELEVVSDVRSGVCYVYKEDVEVPPQESVTYEVRLRDKWNVNKYRIPVLRKLADDVLGRVKARGGYRTVEETLGRIIAELDGIEGESAPEDLNDRYVAFFREQSKRLDSVEEKINRIESAMRPMKKPPQWGFPIKPPSMKTTWLIIYIILGFLAVMSLLFFLRWYGRTKSERLIEGG